MLFTFGHMSFYWLMCPELPAVNDCVGLEVMVVLRIS